jgi:excisionase family DNA binding protein
MEKLLLSLAEAAAQLSIGRSRVDELMRLGELRSVKIGTSRRIPQAALADFIASLRSRDDKSPWPRRGFGVSRWRPVAGRSLPWLRPDGRRITKKVSGATKAEVLRKLRDLRAELNAGMPMPDDRLTVGAFLDRWLMASLPGQVSEKTFDSYADTVRLHITPSLGRKVLRKLREPTRSRRRCWIISKKRALTRQYIGAPGGIRTPNLLIRRSRPGVRPGPAGGPSHSKWQSALRARPLSCGVGCAIWLPEWLPVSQA